MSLPIRVAVFGSCVTRDVFNRKFSPNYKDHFDCVLLANQSTLVSLMSPPIDPDGVDLGDLDRWARADVVADISRSFLGDLSDAQPEYLVVDLFGDVHFGCSELETGIVTKNRWKITRTPFFADTWRRDIPADSGEYLERWQRAAQDFVVEARRRVPGIKILLHEARNVTRFRDADGALADLPRVADLVEMNERWGRLNGIFRELADGSIDVMREDTASFEGHPWGKFAVHYELDYHARFLSRLTAVALEDARGAGRPAERPSLRSRLLGRARR